MALTDVLPRFTESDVLPDLFVSDTVEFKKAVGLEVEGLHAGLYAAGIHGKDGGDLKAGVAVPPEVDDASISERLTANVERR